MARKFAFITLLVVLLGPLAAFADDDDDNDNKLKAVPFAFVGTAAQCGGPAGARIVTSAWLGGMGLPDNGGNNFDATTPGDPPNKRDPHLGLLLNKNGATAICSSAGAEITGVNGKTVTSTFHVGLDYRNGGHCGAGAPRFNIDTDMGFFFVGCSAAPHSPAPQDPGEWTRTRSVLTACGSECFPGPIPVGAKINSIDIVFDEGTDNPVAGDAEGIGLAVVDNIDINDRLIRRGSGIEDGIYRDKGKDKDNDKHDD